MEFSVEHCKKSLDFALAGDDASLDESGNLDRGSSSRFLVRNSAMMIM